jgi:hypothetical protein
MLVLTALMMLEAASSPVPSTADRWRAMSTQELAAKLLPRRTARRIVTNEFLPNSRVLLSTRPAPTPDGFCERDQFLVPTGSPSKMQLIADIYRGDCPAEGIAGFVHVTPNPRLHVAQAKLAILWLEGAIASARARMALPFDVDCVADGQPGLCADSRAALAGLSVQNVQTVGGAFTCKPGEAQFEVRAEPGVTQGPVWKVDVSRGTARPRLTMRLMAKPARS